MGIPLFVELDMKVLTTVDELKARGLWKLAWDVITNDFGKESCEQSIDTSKSPPTVVLTESQARKLGLLPPFVAKEKDNGHGFIKDK